MRICALSAALGDNCRVGLEGSLWDGRGQLAKTNAAQRPFAGQRRGWNTPVARRGARQHADPVRRSAA
ncbi:3-keto-5-aminohexanoate cleavage protein [Rudaea sp.]|uniref:3-keto-5-aminohexanoate cleavage protein n=1 Tax=Rudaea sp. TaxID=2136325 RepID=UPI0039E3DD95